MLERHQEVVSEAEARSRLEGWQPRERLAVLVASLLRTFADRLDGRTQHSPSSVRTTPG